MSAIEHMEKTKAKYANKKIKDLPEHIADQKEDNLRGRASKMSWERSDKLFDINVMSLDQKTINEAFELRSLIDILMHEAFEKGYVEGYKAKEDEI